MICREPICVQSFFRLLVRVRDLVESMQPDRYTEARPYALALKDAKSVLAELEEMESRIVMRDVRDGIESRMNNKEAKRETATRH